ncbi:putative colanic acid biosynthesis acetyltransferase [Pseudomonas sp. HY2-MNA-CIBAN-0224]|uniref:putative colanic acid biosynthesis acetyltransferase n=1 Tax=Pseudomonas sp. HY2-MNA-CIBAN-0224 TaxID=3140471 RepID=UPI00332E8F7B
MTTVSLKENKSPFSTKNKVARVLWWFANVFFSLTPYWALNSLRIATLRIFGAKIGVGCVVYPSAKIWAPWNLSVGNYSCIGPYTDIYSMGPIKIGSNVTISQHAVICTGTHDIATPHNDLIIKSVEIMDQAWICAYAKIMPGVTVSEGAVVGMAALLTKNAQPWGVYGGNPAKLLKEREVQSD